jgi:hypothetical protein
MAEKLLKYYKYINDHQGLQGKITLAQKTIIPSQRAAMEPDSPENIMIFKKAIAEITGSPAPDF